MSVICMQRQKCVLIQYSPSADRRGSVAIRKAEGLALSGIENDSHTIYGRQARIADRPLFVAVYVMLVIGRQFDMHDARLLCFSSLR